MKNKKKILIISGLSILCLGLLTSTYFLTKEPETEFTPVAAVQEEDGETWREPVDETIEARTEPATITNKPEETSVATGTANDKTQEIVSEEKNSTVSSLSDSKTKKETENTKPELPPVTTDDTSDPDKQPSYEESVPQQTPTPASPKTQKTADSKDSSHKGQVYDPVFGWVTPSEVQQDTIDSDGDINKQVGTMGEN